MKINLANHYGMCFGVRDALRKTHETAERGPATVLGQLVHNPVVQAHLATLGVRQGHLEVPGSSETERVIITAHGAADRHREAWRKAGYAVTDTTCPLVRKAHTALARLVAAGCRPVVIGQAGHVEVRGLCGDFPEAVVVEDEAGAKSLPAASRYGVVAQTTQPLERVLVLLEVMKRHHPGADFDFRDTVCQPTKDRQSAMEALCQENDLIVVVGGKNSNNTRQLSGKARAAGKPVFQVETPEELEAQWFAGVERVGVTAGTSTPDETVQAVLHRIRLLASEPQPSGAGALLAAGLRRAAAAVV